MYNSSYESERIYNEFRRRGVKYLIHFTPVENVPYILRYGIIPVEDAKSHGVNPVCTDSLRLDGHRDCVCFSVSFPNHSMFYFKRREMGGEFAVLKIDIEAIRELDKNDMMFFPANAAGNRFSRTSPTGVEYVRRMFDGYRGRPLQLPSCYPADVQAEVLIRGGLKSRYIREINVDSASAFSLLKASGADRYAELCLDRSMFNMREYYLKYRKGA